FLCGLERGYLLTGFGVPEDYRFVLACRGEHLAALAERDGEHRAGVALERVEVLAVVDVPNLDEFILAGTGKAFAVRSRRDRLDRLCVACQRFQLLTAWGVPDFDLPFPLFLLVVPLAGRSGDAIRLAEEDHTLDGRHPLGFFRLCLESLHCLGGF